MRKIKFFALLFTVCLIFPVSACHTDTEDELEKEIGGNSNKPGNNDNDDDDDDSDNRLTRCTACKGSGVCVFCHGDGVWIGEPGRDCKYCDGTGLCEFCDGTGYI